MYKNGSYMLERMVYNVLIPEVGYIAPVASQSILLPHFTLYRINTVVVLFPFSHLTVNAHLFQVLILIIQKQLKVSRFVAEWFFGLSIIINPLSNIQVSTTLCAFEIQNYLERCSRIDLQCTSKLVICISKNIFMLVYFRFSYVSPCVLVPITIYRFSISISICIYTQYNIMFEHTCYICTGLYSCVAFARQLVIL